jgi:hypothetical protein
VWRRSWTRSLSRPICAMAVFQRTARFQFSRPNRAPLGDATAGAPGARPSMRRRGGCLGQPMRGPRRVVLILAYTGLRFGELTGLKVEDVDLDARRIRVRRSMTQVGGRSRREPEVQGGPAIRAYPRTFGADPQGAGYSPGAMVNLPPLLMLTTMPCSN